ncbi:LytR C-terminal domain-containing protein [Nocardioides insulae]|uniref:LytR C-terminal domain-containing protein n=1 Tax=Nocardioides insulae TaxID=394734 RepID=UPI00040B5FC8|nr:LytR C-terminal domain-containing protein [Nocardioides insulae]
MRAFLPRSRHSEYRSRTARPRDERGAVLSSPVVLLSVAAVAVAAVAFFATGDDQPEERDITPVAEAPSATTSPSATSSPTAEPTQKKPKPKPKPKPIERGQTYVVVFNNSGITGLAGEVSGQASSAGWNVVGADNWYGTIPDNTVYYPGGMEREAEQLALDLGIDRVSAAVDPMQMDRLTVILTSPLD